MNDDELEPEDAKLLTLARAARARTNAAQGAAVRDADGRTYVAVTIALPSLQLSALQLAVAMAVASGAPQLLAAVVLGGEGRDDAGERTLHDVSDVAGVFHARDDGSLV